MAMDQDSEKGIYNFNPLPSHCKFDIEWKKRDRKKGKQCEDVRIKIIKLDEL